MKRFLIHLFLKIKSFFFGKKQKEEPVKHQSLSTLGYSVSFGDVLFCKMPLSEEELQSIPEHHRRRPYLVMDTASNGVHAFYGTSKVKAFDNNDMQWFRHYFEEPSYKINDAGEREDVYYTYFNVKTAYFIPTENILNKQYSLSESEKQSLIRKNHLVANKKSKIKIQPYLQKGDVIQKENAQWYIYQSTPDILYVYPFLPKNTSCNCVSVHLPVTKRSKFVDCNNPKQFAREEINGAMTTLGPKDIAIVDNKRKQMIKIARSTKEDPAKRIFFLHPFGEILYDSRWGNKFIYLYSIRRADYVIDLFHSSEDELEIIDINYAKRLTKYGLSEEDVLYEIFNAFYDVNLVIHAIADSIATDGDSLQLHLIQSESRNNNKVLHTINEKYTSAKESVTQETADTASFM